MDPAIQTSRDVALSILKPSTKELDRGLKLHRESLVCDAYGLAPSAWFNQEPLLKAFKDGIRPEILNLFCETEGITGFLSSAPTREAFRELWDESGVTCVLRNAGQEGSDMRLLRRLAGWNRVCDVLPDIVFKAVTPEDMLRARKENRHCLYLSTNGVPLPGRNVTVEEELSYIGVFFQLGVRMMHLTYNRRNLIGDGCAEPANGGLSDFGRAVVKEMNRVGVIVDIAHSGWQTSLEAAKASTRPMVASHSICASLYHHIRGKPDDVIRAIADTGGYIGITCVPDFLGRTGDIASLLDHVDHVAKTFGVDHVAIGTDMGCATTPLEKPVRWPWNTSGQTPGWESFWPPEAASDSGKWNTPEQLRSMAWTNWPLFTVGLVQRGYSDDDIRKIIGGNVLRVARAVYPGE